MVLVHASPKLTSRVVTATEELVLTTLYLYLGVFKLNQYETREKRKCARNVFPFSNSLLDAFYVVYKSDYDAIYNKIC